uniref:Uncharacterized protein n=1 Tax=Anguilla anguilla TaxID=7936 RepID=A0A0E9UE87_ANGAN
MFLWGKLTSYLDCTGTIDLH